ncbi:MAG: hypothetical protein HGA49_00345 [Eubacteriaceae bacterium]|nr:hypothetical protein [Eubacteriaceae bacterium]
MKHGVTIELDKPRTLRYGMNALIKIEEMTGKNLTKLELDNISIKDLRTIIYAGLYHEDKSLTPEKCADLIDEYSDIGTAAEKLGEAMTLAFGSNQGNQQAMATAKSSI